jgi:hypothetical protein
MLMSILDTAASLAPPALALAATLAQLTASRHRDSHDSGGTADTCIGAETTANLGVAHGTAATPGREGLPPADRTARTILVIAITEYMVDPAAVDRGDQ